MRRFVDTADLRIRGNQKIAIAIERQNRRNVEIRIGCRHAISVIPLRAAARVRCDDAVDIDAPDARVARVGNIKVSCAVGRDVVRRVEPRILRRPVVA